MCVVDDMWPFRWGDLDHMRTITLSRRLFPRVSHGRPNFHGLCHEQWMFIFRFDGRRFLPVGAKLGRSRSFGIPGSVLWAQQAAEQRGAIGLPRPLPRDVHSDAGQTSATRGLEASDNSASWSKKHASHRS